MPFILALGRQRQTDFSKLKTSLVYKGSSRTARTYTEKSCLKASKQTKNFKYCIE